MIGLPCAQMPRAIAHLWQRDRVGARHCRGMARIARSACRCAPALSGRPRQRSWRRAPRSGARNHCCHPERAGGVACRRWRAAPIGPILRCWRPARKPFPVGHGALLVAGGRPPPRRFQAAALRARDGTKRPAGAGGPQRDWSNMAEAQALADREPSDKRNPPRHWRIPAPGRSFEWYDFFIYGTLAYILKDAFYATDNETLGLLLVVVDLRGRLRLPPAGCDPVRLSGDRLGRKYTFLVTVTLDGHRHRGRGRPDPHGRYHRHGLRRSSVILLRVIQGLALGGEIRRGGDLCRRTRPARKSAASTPASFRQAWRAGSCCRSSVVLACRFLIPAEDFEAWGVACALPAVDRAACHIAVDAAEIVGKSGVSGDEGSRRDERAIPSSKASPIPGNKKRILRRLVRASPAFLTTIWYTPRSFRE